MTSVRRKASRHASGHSARQDVPAPGLPLGTAVERLAVRFRTAEAALFSSSGPELVARYASLFGARDRGLAESVGDEQARATWALLGVWAVARIANPRPLTLEEAEQWFFGREDGALIDCFSIDARDEVEALLKPIDQSALADLLPYLFDPHGPGTRRSVLRDPTLADARSAKRRHGIFYTPGDVADFMTEWVVGDDDVRVLDPACGTGVFLRSAARRFKRDLSADDVLARLYGVDLDPIAIDAACFVLAATLVDVARDVPPSRLWQLARLNIARGDSISLLLADDGFARSSVARSSQVAGARRLLRAAIVRDSELPAAIDPGRGEWSATFSSLFPEAEEGFAVVGNPPYSPLGQRPDIGAFAARAAGMGGVAVSQSTSAFLPFVELMWRLSHGRARAALVVPLSLAYNTTRPYQSVRRAMAAAGGTWTLRFFDRTPDALFGDDVKQRASIVFRQPSEGLSVRTSGLIRWTSRQRASLFDELPEPVECPDIDTAKGIPKLGAAWELEIFSRLPRRGVRLENTLNEAAPSGSASVSTNAVAVGSTAYNWLVLYRDMVGEGAVTTRRLLAESGAQADWAYAVLSSGLVYWLWRVWGDGFHVPAAWLANLPFQWTGSPTAIRVAELGRELWEDARGNAVVAVNNGLRTVSFRPSSWALVRPIDQLLLQDLGLDPAMEEHLSRFRDQTIEVGRETNH